MTPPPAHLPPTVHIMTAGLTPGDAISNFMLSSGRILRQWGSQVYLYADHVAPQYGHIARHSRFYPNSGQDFLWFHYSIHADNVALALASRDKKIMDFHGICPPELFAGQNEHLAALCQTGLDGLPALKGKFAAYVVHSEYSREWLLRLGFPVEQLYKLFLSVDTSLFTGEDADLGAALSRLEYFLMVGRIVPQKDVMALLEIFRLVQAQRPSMALILVGTRQQAPKYQRQIDQWIARHGLQGHVLLTDQISNTAVLEALFRHARLLFVTSEWESFCVPVAESLYFGVPVVVHDLPPLPEVAGPGGLVVDKRNPVQAAAQVLALLADNGRYQQMRHMAREWANQYSDAALANNLQQFFNWLYGVRKPE